MKNVRRTQADRSATSQAALVAAARSVLSELGFKGATTAAIASRAGVSTGSLHHHYATKEDLFVAVLDDVSETTIRELERLSDENQSAAEFSKYAVDVLWAIYGDRQYWAVWEINIGWRSDKAMAEIVSAHRGDVREQMDAAIAASEQLSPQTKGVLLRQLPFMLCTMRGMFMETFAAQLPDLVTAQLEKLVSILHADLLQAARSDRTQ